jgi:hypothetical protein
MGLVTFGVRVEWKPQLTVSKAAVWFGAPRQGRALRIAPEVEPWDVAFQRVLHQVRRNEPLRIDRRLFRLSHAAMAGSFSMA